MPKIKKAKTPVFFIATQVLVGVQNRKEPVEVAFYTNKGEQVNEEDVIKKKTKEGVRLYTYQQQRSATP